MLDPGAERLQQHLGYRFQDSALLTLALTHTSYANENGASPKEHNERLEFLGDAVLDLVISDALMTRFPELAEGELSKLRASLVTESSLAEIARELDLGTLLRMGKGEDQSGGRRKDSLLADALEALLAAVYLDSREPHGVAAVQAVILALYAGRLEHADGAAPFFDFKTELQEWVQKTYRESVQYRIVRAEGPDHDKTFEAAVLFHNREFGRGLGRSKKQAEQAAARNALSQVRDARPAAR